MESAALGTVNFVNFTAPEGTFFPKVTGAYGTVTFVTYGTGREALLAKVTVSHGAITFITFALPDGLPGAPESGPLGAVSRHHEFMDLTPIVC